MGSGCHRKYYRRNQARNRSQIELPVFNKPLIKHPVCVSASPSLVTVLYFYESYQLLTGQNLPLSFFIRFWLVSMQFQNQLRIDISLTSPLHIEMLNPLTLSLFSPSLFWRCRLIYFPSGKHPFRHLLSLCQNLTI